MTNSPGHTQTPRIAFIQAQWHDDIVDQSRHGFLDALADSGIDPDAVSQHRVPGAYDIPLLAKRLAMTDRFDAIVAAGFVVDGGIYRHDFVASTVVQALMQIQLDTGTPILSVVLTPHQFQETQAHENFFKEHFVLKGREAAHACLKIVDNFAHLDLETNTSTFAHPSYAPNIATKNA